MDFQSQWILTGTQGEMPELPALILQSRWCPTPREPELERGWERQCERERMPERMSERARARAWARGREWLRERARARELARARAQDLERAQDRERELIHMPDPWVRAWTRVRDWAWAREREQERERERQQERDWERQLECLDPILSTWLTNMKRLAALVDQLHALACAAPLLAQQVAVLRAALKKQQERCIAFLQLADEYADRYLNDVSEDIQSQNTLLGVLERRLEAAREIHADIAALRSSFEEGTCGGLKDIRAVGKNLPFPEDNGLFQYLESLLSSIRVAFKDLNKFWVGEVGRVTRTLRRRRMEQEDMDLWQNELQGVQRALSYFEEPRPPQEERLQPTPAGTDRDRGLGTTAVALVPALFAIREKLTSVLQSVAMSFLKPKQSVGVRKSSANLETNERMCFSVLTSCVRYGERAVAACAKILQMRPYARVADVDELRERAREVRAWRIDEAAFSTNAGNKAYGRVLAKAKTVLHDVDRSFRSMLTRKNTAFAMLASAKEPDLHLSVAQLGRRLRSCKAEHDALAAGLRVVSAMVVDLVVD